MSLESLGIKVLGHLKLEGKQTGEVIVDKFNAIHPQNLARIFARALANENYHHVVNIALGNGGSFIDSAGNIIFNAPNTVGIHSKLYNETYSETVDGSVSNGNTVISAASAVDITSLVTITATIAADEPSDQNISDTQSDGQLANPPNTADYTPTTDFGYSYNFDEMGIRTKNPLYTGDSSSTEPEFLLLTHIVFSPIEKTANRELILTYTLQISVS